MRAAAAPEHPATSAQAGRGIRRVRTVPARRPESAITVRGISALPNLRFDVLAGHGGLANLVSWAFVADRERPWEWVDPGDLILTSGWVIPSEPSAQCEFIERTVEAGASGLIVGADGKCPTLAADMLVTADRTDFPVLRAHHDTSWASVIRYIARANEGRDGHLLSAIMQVHDIVRVGLQTQRTSHDFMEAISDLVRCELYMVDWELWEPVLPRTAVPPPAWREALADALANRGVASSLLSVRLEMGTMTALALPVPRTESPTFLFVDVSSGHRPRLALLQHVCAACALELAHVDAHFDRQRRAGGDLLSEAMQGRLPPPVFADGAARAGVTSPWLCIAVDGPMATIRRLSRSWAVHGKGHLLMRSADAYLFVVTHDSDLIEEVRILSRRYAFRAGASAPLRSDADLCDARRQALWALETVHARAAGLARYEDLTGTFLPRTLLEAEEAVRQVLGPVIDYDREHNAELVKTLETYLTCERSPSQAAAALFVHSQTVSYRLGRIEELTGRSLRATADISEMWLAVRALSVTDTGKAGS